MNAFTFATICLNILQYFCNVSKILNAGLLLVLEYFYIFVRVLLLSRTFKFLSPLHFKICNGSLKNRSCLSHM